jgi:hypothetical protein
MGQIKLPVLMMESIGLSQHLEIPYLQLILEQWHLAAYFHILEQRFEEVQQVILVQQALQALQDHCQSYYNMGVERLMELPLIFL